MDGAVRSNIIELVEQTTKRDDQPAPAVRERQLLALLSLLAQGDEYAQAAHSTLQAKLEDKHALTRLLALEVCDALFRKSKAFRRLLCGNFQGFLEVTVGYKQEKPLPPPLDTAEVLRQRALEVVERWRDQHGKECPQGPLVAGIVADSWRWLSRHTQRYLRDCLGLRLPELRARSALRQEQQAARRARTQQLLMERFWALPQELPALRQEVQKLLEHMASCEDLLLGRQPETSSAAQGVKPAETAAPGPQQAALVVAATGSRELLVGSASGPSGVSNSTNDIRGLFSLTGDADPDALPGQDGELLEWEDVEAEDLEAQGLAAYAALEAGDAGTVRRRTLAAAALASGLDEGTRQGVLDNMSDLSRQLARRVQRLRGWLTLLVQLDLTAARGSGPGVAGGSVGLATSTRAAAALPRHTSGGVGTAAGSTSDSLPAETSARIQRDRLLREVVGLKNQAQAALAQARACGAHVPDTAFQEANAGPGAPVNVSLTVVAGDVEGVESEEEEGGAGVVGGRGRADEAGELERRLFGEEEDEGEGGGDGVAGEGNEEGNAGLEGLGNGRASPSGSCLSPGVKRPWEVSAAGSSASAGGRLQTGGYQPEVARAVERATARAARMRQPERGQGSGGAAAAAPAVARVTYNDRVTTAQGDEGAARRLQEQLQAGEQGPVQGQRAGGTVSGSGKKAKLTGKALIKKQLGLR